MCQGMSACADRKAYADVLRLLDLNLADDPAEDGAAVDRRRRPRLPGSVRRSRCGGRQSLCTRIWVGSSYRTVSIDFPRGQ